jgi:retron-type reverse transcriptase
MKVFIFPRGWHLNNIQSIEALANKINFSPEEIKLLSNTADKNFRKKEIKGRTLFIPSPQLKNLQRLLLERCFFFDFPVCVQGGIRGRSIISNAKIHRCKKWVANVDIKKFFPSAHYTNIENIFKSLGVAPHVAKTLTRLTTFKYQLPQGAPTSPFLANLLLYSLDKRISNLCKKLKFSYTRYFDDITISGSQNPTKIISKVKLIIEQEGYRMHVKEKLKILPSSEEQTVTGLVVNKKQLQLPAGEEKNIFILLNQLTKKNYPAEFFDNHQKFKKSLEGKIAFFISINKKKGKKAQRIYKNLIWPDT